MLSYSVSRRARELGIRRALGARATSIFGTVVGRGMGQAALGLVVGLLAALGLARGLEGLLFGVSSTEPVALGLVVLFLLAVALVACLVPARRATRVDPARVLAEE